MFENYRDFIEFCQPYWVDGMGLDTAHEAAVEAMIRDLGHTRESAVAEADRWLIGVEEEE